MKKAYSTYRDTQIPWIKKIPEVWEEVKIKFLFSERVEKGFPDEPLLAATQAKGVVPKELYENRTVMVQKDFHLLKLVREGDFVVSLRSFQGGLEYAYYQGIISPAYTIMKPSSKVFGGYFKYLFKSKNFIDDLTTYVTGIREGQNIDYSDFRDSFSPLPSLLEQRQIATYLDHKCSLIDIFIKKKTQLIELLQEERQAIINHAVTKGLDPNVPMKFSGVDSLGDIPRHWEVRKTKYLFKEVDIRSTTGQEELLSVSHYDGVTPRSEKQIYMFMAESYVGYKMCDPGDLVINIMWAWMGALGVSDKSGIISSGYCVYRPIKPNTFNWRYLDLLSRIKPYVGEYTKKSKGIHSSRWRMYTDDFFQISYLIPPIAEQVQITEYLEEEEERINRTIISIQKEVELVEEYRMTLIAEAVTGKIDVRDWKPEKETDIPEGLKSALS